jgi:hypothetical protein
VGERLEEDVVAALRPRGAIPRPMKSNEGAAAIGLRKLHAHVDLQIIWRPVSGKCGDRRLLLRAILRSSNSPISINCGRPSAARKEDGRSL